MGEDTPHNLSLGSKCIWHDQSSFSYPLSHYCTCSRFPHSSCANDFHVLPPCARQASRSMVSPLVSFVTGPRNSTDLCYIGFYDLSESRFGCSFECWKQSRTVLTNSFGSISQGLVKVEFSLLVSFWKVCPQLSLSWLVILSGVSKRPLALGIEWKRILFCWRFPNGFGLENFPARNMSVVGNRCPRAEILLGFWQRFDILKARY